MTDKPAPREIIAEILHHQRNANPFDELDAEIQEFYRTWASEVIDGLATFGWTLLKEK